MFWSLTHHRENEAHSAEILLLNMVATIFIIFSMMRTFSPGAGDSSVCFSFFSHTHGTSKFPDQGLNLSYINNLNCSCVTMPEI